MPLMLSTETINDRYRGLKKKLLLVVKGMGMGGADIIPGVSGGTIALISGIYEDLIASISAIQLKHLKYVFLLFSFNQEKRKESFSALAALPWHFIIFLILGVGMGLIVGVFLITHLMHEYPFHTYGFFFALILFSVPIPFAYTAKKIPDYLMALVFAVGFFFLVGFSPTTIESPSLLYIFLGGAVAICAMILPGISGSYILLAMGLYKFVTTSLKSALKTFETSQLTIMAVFISGVLVGIFSFVRLLKYLLNRWQGPTMAALTGVLIGSLRKLYPMNYTELAASEITVGSWLILAGLFALALVIIYFMYQGSKSEKFVSEP